MATRLIITEEPAYEGIIPFRKDRLPEREKNRLKMRAALSRKMHEERERYDAVLKRQIEPWVIRMSDET